MKSQLYQALQEPTVISFIICTEKVSSMGESSKPQCLGSEASRGGCLIQIWKKAQRPEREKNPISFSGNQPMPPWTGAAVRQWVMKNITTCAAGGLSGRQIVINWDGAWPGFYGGKKHVILQSYILTFQAIFLSQSSYVQATSTPCAYGN